VSQVTLTHGGEIQTNLDKHARAARGAYAGNTERALRADVATFTGWCSEVGLASLPAEPGTIAAFVDTMGDVKAPATVRRYVSSIATFHRAARLPNPTADEVVRLALRRLHRLRGRAQVQATALTRNLIERMLEAAGSGLRAQRNRALLAMAYDTLARRSELVALDRADLEDATDHGTITIRRSKTDQEGMGQVRYVAPDSMREVRAWLTAAGHDDGPLFRAVSKSGAIGGPLDPGDVARVFKAMARAAGINPRWLPESAGTVAGSVPHRTRCGSEWNCRLSCRLADGSRRRWLRATLRRSRPDGAGQPSWRCCRTGVDTFSGARDRGHTRLANTSR
jgi:integrase